MPLVAQQKRGDRASDYWCSGPRAPNPPGKARKGGKPQSLRFLSGKLIPLPPPGVFFKTQVAPCRRDPPLLGFNKNPRNIRAAGPPHACFYLENNGNSEKPQQHPAGGIPPHAGVFKNPQHHPVGGIPPHAGVFQKTPAGFRISGI